MGDLPAENMARCRLVWPDGCRIGSPFGSPISLAPLTFDNLSRLTGHSVTQAQTRPPTLSPRAWHPHSVETPGIIDGRTNVTMLR